MFAPNNIILGNEALGGPGGEFVFRQPVNRFELDQVIEAAQINVLEAYGCDGNQRWTMPLVRQWWQQQSTIERAVTAECNRQMGLGARMYFLNEGCSPNEGDALPEL